jgi:Ras-related C3 botulinum toxin substrate 1
VQSKWLPELQLHAPGVPFVLVGTKIDLRDDRETVAKLLQKRLAPTTAEHGAKLARDLGALAYVECSALTQKGVKQVFEEAARCVLLSAPAQQQQQHCRCCSLM